MLLIYYFLPVKLDVKEPVRLLIVLVTAKTGAVTAVVRKEEDKEEGLPDDVTTSPLLNSIICTLVDKGWTVITSIRF